MYPTKLSKIINLFDSLPEDERRETLVSYADNAKKQEPRQGETVDLADVRKDEECMDTVGVYLHDGDSLQRVGGLHSAGNSRSPERFHHKDRRSRAGAYSQPDNLLRAHANQG